MGLDQCRGESAATVCFVTKAIYVSMLHHTYCSQHKNAGYISLVIFKIFFLHPSRRVGSGFLENIVKLTEQNKPSINLADASKTCIQAG